MHAPQRQGQGSGKLPGRAHVAAHVVEEKPFPLAVEGHLERGMHVGALALPRALGIAGQEQG
jgi:hypothetical protein